MDLSPVWQVFDTYVEADFSPFWQRNATVTADFTASWEAYGRVGALRVVATQSHIYVDPPTLPTVRAFAKQNRIFATRAA